MGICLLLRDFGETIPMKEWVQPLAGVGAEGSILPEEGAFGEHTGVGVGEPEAENSAVTESSEETMAVEVEQEDLTILPEAALPVRLEVRVQSMKKSPSGADSGARRQAVRPMRVIWPPRTRRPRPLRKASLPRSLLLPHRQEHPLRQPQLDFLLPEVGEFSLHEGYRHAEAEGEDVRLHPCVQAGALQPNPWLPKSHLQVLCHQVRNL